MSDVAGRLTLVIGNRNYSSWSLRAWLFMAHAGIDFETLRLPLDTPEFKRRIGDYSPSRTVPVLLDGHRRVWDSLAICEYVAERFGGVDAWPADEGARALARSISCEMHAGFAALRAELPMNCRARGRRVEAGAAATRDVARVVSIWEEARTAHGATGPWLFGHFSIADAMYAPVALRFATYGTPLTGAAADYAAAVLADEAVGEWLEEAAVEQETIEREERG